MQREPTPLALNPEPYSHPCTARLQSALPYMRCTLHSPQSSALLCAALRCAALRCRHRHCATDLAIGFRRRWHSAAQTLALAVHRCCPLRRTNRNSPANLSFTANPIRISAGVFPTVTHSGTASSRRWRWRSSSCARSWMCSTRGCSSRSRSAARPRTRPKRERLNQAKRPKLRLLQRPTAARAPAHRAHRAKLRLLRRPHRLALKARWCSPIHRHSHCIATVAPTTGSHTAVTDSADCGAYCNLWSQPYTRACTHRSSDARPS